MMQDQEILLANSIGDKDQDNNDNDNDDDNDRDLDDVVISGRVYTDRDNGGLKGVNVYLVDITTEEPNKMNTKTNDFGNYVFESIRPGIYVIGIVDKIYTTDQTDPVLYDGESTPKSNDLATRKIIEVRDGEDDPLRVEFGYHRLEEDVYSMLFFAADQDNSKAFVAYLYVGTVFMIQIALLTLMLIDVHYYSHGRWLSSNYLPTIIVPVEVSRFIVCLLAAASQSSLYALGHDIFSGYGEVFPHRRRANSNVLFILVCTSRFGIKAIVLLLALITILQNENIFDILSNFIMAWCIYQLHKIAFQIALMSKSPAAATRRGGRGIWNQVAKQTKEHVYLKIRGRALFIRRLQLIFITSTMPGMWAWTRILGPIRHYNTLFPNHTTTPMDHHQPKTDDDDEPPNPTNQGDDDLSKELLAFLQEIQKGHRHIQDLQKGHKTRMQKIRDTVVSALDSNQAAEEKLIDIQKSHEVDVKRLEDEAAVKAHHTNALSDEKSRQQNEEILAEKSKELENLRTTFEEKLREQDLTFEKEVKSLRNAIEVSYNKIEEMQVHHESEVKNLEEKSSSSLATALDKNAQSFQKEIDLAKAEKEKKVKELRSEFEETIRKEQISAKKEMAALQDTIGNKNAKLESMQADYEKEVKKLLETSTALSIASEEKSRLVKEKLDVVKEKNKEIKGLKSSSEQLLRQLESASKKEIASLESEITKARNELENVQRVSSSIATASKGSERLLQEKIDLVLAEKNKEIKELVTSSKEAIRQEKIAYTKELKILQNTIEVANDKIKSMKKDHANELNALSNKSSQSMKENIDAVLSEKNEELEKVKSDSADLLNDTIQKSNSKIKSMLSKHSDLIKQLKDKSANKEFKELKSICPTLFKEKAEDNDIMIACKYLDPNAYPVSGLYGSNVMATPGGSQDGSHPSDCPVLIPRHRGVDRFVIGTSTVILLTAVSVLPAARSFLFKPIRGIISLLSWLKGYLPM